MIFYRRLEFCIALFLRGCFWAHTCFLYMQMIFANHYKKAVLTFMLMIRVFFYQNKCIHKIEDVLTKKFSTLCSWFVDNKLSIHCGENNTKHILFSKTKRSSNLSITEIITLRQCYTVEYLGCYLDYNGCPGNNGFEKKSMQNLNFLISKTNI